MSAAIMTRILISQVFMLAIMLLSLSWRLSAGRLIPGSPPCPLITLPCRGCTAPLATPASVGHRQLLLPGRPRSNAAGCATASPGAPSRGAMPIRHHWRADRVLPHLLKGVLPHHRQASPMLVHTEARAALPRGLGVACDGRVAAPRRLGGRVRLRLRARRRLRRRMPPGATVGLLARCCRGGGADAASCMATCTSMRCSSSGFAASIRTKERNVAVSAVACGWGTGACFGALFDLAAP